MKNKLLSSVATMRTKINRWYGTAKMSLQGGFSTQDGISTYHTASAGNEHIKEALMGDVPFLAARYGLYELLGVARVRYGYTGNIMHRLCMNAGFFPRDESLIEKFAEVYSNASRAIDTFGAWNFRHGLWRYEESVFDDLCPHAYLTDIRAIKFLEHSSPWTASLEGKRVLVIHPFVDTIEKQYQKRGELFENQHMLPEFSSLITLRAVQSAAGSKAPFDTWFDALNHMKERMARMSFDVALIGAGAYGLPLAAYAKRQGKQAVHMGGITQMLFGIFGNRWKDRYGDLVNPNWTRPARHEVPPKAKEIEAGAYW
jgi:hypothetical protein